MRWKTRIMRWHARRFLSSDNIGMTKDDFYKVMLAANVLSNALLVLDEHPEVEITDLDGDPFPEARDAWLKACNDAHEALGRAKYI